MTDTIYIVYASKHFYYEGSHNSVVLTTFCPDQAISFAKKYQEKANTLLSSFMSCDYVSVSVISTIIGEPNTESIVWTSTGFSVSSQYNNNNTEFSINPETTLINNMTYNQSVNVQNYFQIKPTFSFASGLSTLEISYCNHTFDFTQYKFDEIPYLYSVFDSPELISNALAKGFITAIVQDSESNDNKKSWDIYRFYEQQYFLR